MSRFHCVVVFVLVLGVLSVSGTFAWADNNNESKDWFDNFIFSEPTYVFEFIRVLGASYGMGSDLGECVDTARRMGDVNDKSWYEEWYRTAERIYGLASQWENDGYLVSARNAYLRASNYYRSACFYLSSKEDREKSIDIWRKSRDSFLKAVALTPNIEVIRIPYENTSLPGYFIKTADSSYGEKPPLLIVHTGFDGTAEELYFGPGVAAVERGYNCLIFEGPGQGGALREGNLHFRHDWEKVVTPVVDYALTRQDVDEEKIILMGISMGGYLAPRAAAFEHRLLACIANGGVYDFSSMAYERTPAELLELLDTEPDLFNQYLMEAAEENLMLSWSLGNGMWTFGVPTPADYYKAIKKYNLEGISDKIQCHMLVIDSVSDLFMTDQPKILYDSLTGPKTYMKFTREETAQAHCQMGASAISSENIFNWMDDLVKNR